MAILGKSAILAAQGVIMTLALSLLFGIGEATFRPLANEDPDLRRFLLLASTLAALLLLLLQYLYFRLCERWEELRHRAEDLAGENEAFRRQVEALERRRQALSHQVEMLSTEGNISRVAARSASLDDFMEEMARLIRELATAQDLAIFLLSPGGKDLNPHAYYRVNDERELRLILSESGSRIVGEAMRSDPRGEIDPESLGVRGMSIIPQIHSIVVAAILTYRGADVGRLRLALLRMPPESAPAMESLHQVLQEELATVRWDNHSIENARRLQQSFQDDPHRGLMDLAAPLRTEDVELGVVKMHFRRLPGGESEKILDEHRHVLVESARHIAKAIYHDRIYRQAIEDGLTGLYNKRYLMTHLENYWRLAHRHQTALSLILLDLDHFKKVNDTYGHLTGDLVLQETAGILRKSIRECDLACRYGGEELAILLPQSRLEGSLELAERLRRCIERHPFQTADGKPLRVTASIGVAEASPDMMRPEELIARADAALYHAKEGGRNRVIAYRTPTPRGELRPPIGSPPRRRSSVSRAPRS